MDDIRFQDHTCEVLVHVLVEDRVVAIGLWPDGSCLSCGSALVQFVAAWFDIVQRWVSLGSVVCGMCGSLVKFLFSCGSAVWGLSFFD